MAAALTIYSKYGDAQQIMPGDLSYWKTQGWDTVKPTTKAASPTLQTSAGNVNASAGPTGGQGTITVRDPSTGDTRQINGSDYSTWYAKGYQTVQIPAPVSAPAPASDTTTAKTDTAGTATGQMNPADAKAFLGTLGVDTTGLDDTQISWLAMMGKYQQVQAANDKNIAPPSLSAADVQRYTDEAAAELGPQFQSAMGIDKTLVGQVIADTTKDYSLFQQQTSVQQQNELKAQAEQMANAGLAYSGIRQEAEKQLKTSQAGLVESQRSQYERSLRDQAQKLEQQYGAQGVNMAKDLMGKAGLSYTPIGVPAGMGSAEQVQSQNVIARTGQLEQAALGGQANANAAVKPLQPLTSL